MDQSTGTDSAFEQSRRLAGADFLRCVACSIVFLHHLALSIWVGDGSGDDFLLEPFVAIGGYGVVLFFVLSGFLLARPFWLSLNRGETLPSVSIYLQRRFFRIAPGYWVALVLSAVVCVFSGEMRLDSTSIERLLLGFSFLNVFSPHAVFPVEINGPLWSISYEVWAYCILPVCFAAIAGLNKLTVPYRHLLTAWAALICFFILLHALLQQAIYASTSLEFSRPPDELEAVGTVWFFRLTIFGLFVSFAMGALGSGIQVVLRHWRDGFADVISLLALASLLWLLFVIERPPHRGASFWGVFGLPYNNFPIMPVAASVFLAVCPSTKWLHPFFDAYPIRYLASLSYGIYIYHALILFLLMELLTTGTDPFFDQFGAMAVSVGTGFITLVLARFSWVFLEEPIILRAKKREAKFQ